MDYWCIKKGLFFIVHTKPEMSQEIWIMGASRRDYFSMFNLNLIWSSLFKSCSKSPFILIHWWWSPYYLASIPFLLWWKFLENWIWFWSSLFKLRLKEPLSIIDPLLKPLPIWPKVPFYYDKKLWKIEFDFDFHFSNYCSKSPFILILI